MGFDARGAGDEDCDAVGIERHEKVDTEAVDVLRAGVDSDAAVALAIVALVTVVGGGHFDFDPNDCQHFYYCHDWQLTVQNHRNHSCQI